MKRIVLVLIGTMIMTACGIGNHEAKAFKKDSNISVVSREDGSGTRGAFVDLFKIEEKVDGEKWDMTTEEANITNNTAVMISTVQEDPYAVGYISLGSLNDSIKALQIDDVIPSIDSVKNGDYKIARPFNIVTKEKVDENTIDFMNYIMSNQGQKIVEESGYIPVDVKGDYQVTKALQGKIVVSGSSSVTPVIEKLKEEYQTLQSNVEIEIQQSDSTTGVKSTIEGICSIGMVSRDLKESEQESGLQTTTIALDGIVIIVNHHNPLESLAPEIVKGIFTGELTTWQEAIK